MHPNQARGRWGEDLAARWYGERGWSVIDRNWRDPNIGEIDLVVRRGDLLAISEVKARRTDRFGPPALAVGVAKQRRLRQLAAAWLRDHDIGRVTVRFDVVAITGGTIEVIEGAF